MSTSVIYNLEDRKNQMALVTMDEIRGGGFLVPLLALSSGTWTVTWQLPDGYHFETMEFETNQNWPPDLKQEHSSLVSENPSQWTARLHNHAKGANQGDYKFTAIPIKGGASILKDPTIVVTKDPIDS
jgi:hypothetical protein